MKFRNLLNTVAAVALVAVLAVSASAAQLNLNMVYTTSYDSLFGDPGYVLASGVPVLPGTVDPTDLHEFNVFFSLTGTTVSPDESLGGILFDVALALGLSADPGAGYGGITSPNYDPPPAGAAGGTTRPLFSANADNGAADLQRIGIETDAIAAAGLQPGESGDYLIGTFYVNWDGSTNADLNLQPAASAPADPWALFTGGIINSMTPFSTAGVLTAQGPGNFSVGDPFLFRVEFIPEPASAMLACLAVIGCLGLFRRRG